MEQRGQKFFFHRIKKKGEKKRNILFENVRQHDTIGTLRFFFHGSRLRFSLFIAKPVAQPRFDTPPLTYTCTPLASPLRQVVVIEIYATKGVREKERKRRDKEKFSKILQEDVSRERGYSSFEEESQYSRVMTDNYLEGFGTKEGSRQGRGGLKGGGKHVSLVNDNDEHWCKPDDNA